MTTTLPAPSTRQPLLRLGHYARHGAMLAGFGLLHGLIGVVDPRQFKHPSFSEQRAIQRRFFALLRRDVEDAEAGRVPADVLRSTPVKRLLAGLPEFWRDSFAVANRRKRNAWMELPDVDLEAYPEYLRRTYHWQSDGYFSTGSARRYDLGVELLFLGTADAMRRRMLPHLLPALAGGGRLLDVATGTGNTLRLMQQADPQAELHGIDVSPWYLDVARERLGDGVTLQPGLAEQLPHEDDAFDATSCVYLFHELPPTVRTAAAAELARVTKPGGVVVLVDSVQDVDSPDIATPLRNFPRSFHEPYYDDYLQDDLAQRLTDAGLQVVADESHYITRVVAARKPRA